MRNRLYILGVTFLILLTSVGGTARQGPPPDKINLDNYTYIEDQLLVSFKPSVGSERSNQVLADLGIERIRKIEPLGVDLVHLPPGLTVEKALEMFSHRPDVVYAEPNFLLEITGDLQAEVANLEVVDQWGLNKIEAPLAWTQIDTPNTVVIAVVDTGVDNTNPDLFDNIWQSASEIPGDGIDNDNNGYIDDTWGWDFVNGDNDPMDDQMHGTAVSSVAAGNNNGQGVAGVCPWCEIMAVKVLSAEGSGSLDVAASGIIYAADQGAQIINLSMSAPMGMQTLENAVNYAWDAGVLVVAAAGNDGSETTVYPAAYANAMAVAATDIDDHHACYSNYTDDFVSVSAPGSNVLFAYLPGGTASGSGTSLASPHVAGLAGLLLSQNDSLSNQQLWSLIEATTNDLGPTGTDAFFGTGRINAYRAVMGDTTPTTPPEQSGVLVDDPTAYAHARKIARSADGTLHRVWHDKAGSDYVIKYAFSTDDGLTWSQPQTIFTTPAETYHPAITLDKDNLYVVFPTLSGASAYQIGFSTKPISGGSWTPTVSIMGGSYNAVRPDIYLDPSNQRLHVVASSLDDAQFVYYRSSDDGGQTWTAVKNVDFVNYTRYAGVYAYGDNVYIASRTTDGNFLIPTFRMLMMRSLNGGATWQDRVLFDTHTALTSSEYGLSLTGYQDTLFLLYEHDGYIRFGKSTNGVNWDRVNVYSNGEGKWPSITTAADGRAWFAWLNASGVVEMRKYLGGPVTVGSSYQPAEALYSAKFPNFKEGTNHGQVEWVTTNCNAAPFDISSDNLADGANTPPYAFFDAPASANAGVEVSFDASPSYDMDGDTLTYSWDFGDGNNGSGQNPAHTYQAAGSYTVILNLSDGSGGSDSTSALVEVTGQLPTDTPTPTATATDTAIPTPTATDTPTPTDPPPDTPTNTPTDTPTDTPTPTPTDTPTATPTDTPTPTPTDTPIPAAYLHIGDLDGSRTTIRNKWVAIVSIQVHDGQHNPVAGALVSGTWSGGASGTASCTTDAGGLCTLASAEIPKKTGTATFTVNNVTHAALSYAPALNHDPETDSDGTSILVYLDPPADPVPTPTPTPTPTDTPIPPPGGADLHIGDLDGSSTLVHNKWEASVVITAHDENDTPLPGVTVTGLWSTGDVGSCTTGADGTCTLTNNGLRTNMSTVDFQVTGASLTGYNYLPASNHDPDGDSNGTTIVIAAP